MTSFVLRIYFLGLMSFVPDPLDQEMQVLVLDAQTNSYLTENSSIEHHPPLLMARGRCEGDCGAQEANEIAALIAPNSTSGPEARANLDRVLQGGGAWLLSNSELSLSPSTAQGKAAGETTSQGNPVALTLDTEELRAFHWVVKLKDLVGEEYSQIDPVLLTNGASDPRLAARLRLSEGHLRSRTLFKVGDQIAPVAFRSAAVSKEVAAASDSAMLEVEIDAQEVEIIATDSLSGHSRRMRLSPDEPGGVVEVALLNAPVSSYDPVEVGQRSATSPKPGHHFELYYDLAQSPAPKQMRPIPHLGNIPKKTTLVARPDPNTFSDLLQAIGLVEGRGAYDRVLCPLSCFP